MCARASDESWQAKHCVAIGEFTSVVAAASVGTPVAAATLKPEP